MRGPCTGAFQAPVWTVLPCQDMSLGIPVLTDSSVAIADLLPGGPACAAPHGAAICAPGPILGLVPAPTRADAPPSASSRRRSIRAAPDVARLGDGAHPDLHVCPFQPTVPPSSRPGRWSRPPARFPSVDRFALSGPSPRCTPPHSACWWRIRCRLVQSRLSATPWASTAAWKQDRVEQSAIGDSAPAISGSSRTRPSTRTGRAVRLVGGVQPLQLWCLDDHHLFPRVIVNTCGCVVRPQRQWVGVW